MKLEGALNFRDLGGFTTTGGRVTRAGRLFRSNSLQEVTPDDVATLVEHVGVRLVIDLRDEAEVSRDGRGPLESHPGLRWLSASLRKPSQAPGVPGYVFTGLADRYMTYLAAEEAIVAVLETLAAPGALPAVFHCSAGKDRTGVIAALLLTLLGVPRDQVVADYVATAGERDRLVAFLRRRPSYANSVDDFHPDLLSSDPATMETFLARLEAEHGSVRAWALGIGLSPETLSRLEAALLGP